MIKRNNTHIFIYTILLVAVILLSSVYLPTQSHSPNLRVIADSSKDGEYYYVTQDTPLRLVDSQSKGSIVVPSTYYVRAIDSEIYPLDGVVYRKVSYNNVIGLINADAISQKSISNIADPYFAVKENLKVDSEKANNNELWLYSEISSTTINGTKLSPDIQLKFIAKSADDPQYMYVKTIGEQNERYGFVQSKNYLPIIQISKNPHHINPDIPSTSTTPTIPDSSEKQPNTTTSSNTVRIILIVLLCLLAVLVVFLIFKPSKKKKSTNDDFYDIE